MVKEILYYYQLAVKMTIPYLLDCQPPFIVSRT